jgi:integrase
MMTQAMLFTILGKLSSLEKRLEKDIPYLDVEEAIAEYWRQHLNRTKNPRSYKYLMNRFQERFKGRNIAEIAPEEIEQFILSIAEHPNTQTQRATQLKGFFNWANKYLMKKGAPTFHNPMNVLEFVRQRETPKFIPTEHIITMIELAQSLKEKLVVSILATSGMRAGELADLTVEDVKGRVLTIRNPKSLRHNSPVKGYREHAVIPETVAGLLNIYIEKKKPEGRIIGSYKYIYKVIKRLARKAGANITPHDLRRWCATFYERQGEYAMVRFILRHRNGKHHGIDNPVAMNHYLAPLTIEEAMEKQRVMEKILFKKN